MGIDNMFHGILEGIGGTKQLCLILAIILALLYITRSTLLKLCKRKPSGLLNALTTLFQRHQQIQTLHRIIQSYIYI